MSLADVTSARSSPSPDTCPECDTSASVTSDLHKYQVACTCKPGSAHYACADDPGPPPPAKVDVPPALPPRPPASVLASNRRGNASAPCPAPLADPRRRKYAWWCVGCGALAAALGGLLAAAHIVLRAYTASPHLLETVPAAVPAAMLVLTGVCIMSLARRRNRYSYMIKVVGACCLVCALTCVLVTITTTVIHMNKLQTLKFCQYTIKTRTCSCFSMPPDLQHSGDDEGVRCAFEGVSDCGVVHGALYWCLRGVFALSVSAVLVCIFSSMLAYQLLSHERKKMYWEQLELRCRSLYRPPSGTTQPARTQQATCSCCAQCHQTQPAWDISLQHRFWAPGRIGNLYSPNPGTGRKTSAWSWFPWPRSNSQNSRSCTLGVPQSGDSAYGFCETDNPQPIQAQYEDRTYYPQRSGNFAQNPGFPTNQTGFPGNSGGFPGNSSGFPGNSGGFPGNPGFGQSQIVQSQFGESNASFDSQTGVWGPPPPYSPQGRSGSRHHLHQDPATATLLHHHHLDHRNALQLHEHRNIQTNISIQNTHACPRQSYMGLMNPEIARLNPDLIRINPEIAHLNPEIVHLTPEIMRLNPELARLNPELARLNPGIYPSEVARLQEMGRLNGDIRLNDGRFNTLRGHLVPYPGCQKSLGVSLGNLHRECRDDVLAVECMHEKSSSKVSDQSTDSSVKQGKENLAFQNDKHSNTRRSMQDCHRSGNVNAESEVYFADVSSCCNVSTDCCMKPNVSALVGTIENQPESTSESESGTFTLTRQQKPQPQSSGSKRRRNQGEKLAKTDKMRQDINNSIRLTEQQIEQLNNSMCQRMNEMIGDISRLNEHSRINDSRLSEISRISDRLNESRSDREFSRINESRVSERLNDSRVSERLNDSRISERMNDSRISERMNDSRVSDRMNVTRISDRMNDSRIERMNETRMSDRFNDTRMSDRNDSRITERMNDSRVSERINDSRMNEHRNEFSRKNELRMSENRLDERINNDRMDLDLTSSPKVKNLRLVKASPTHPRQSSSDSNNSNKNEFNFIQNSPLSPNTEETLVSDEDEPQNSKVYSNEVNEAACLGPDSRYEANKDKNEIKGNHAHTYSDTNTMDSGWQSGSEKHGID